VVTYSAALEEGVEHPDDPIDCQGGMIVVNGLRIHDLHKMGTVSIAEAMAKSSDVAAVKVGLKLGDDRLYKYIRAYGFGSQTGIELPGETRGLAKPVNKWSKVSIGAISIGQEVGVTPLQLVSMISTIANDGVYLPPRILAGTTKPSNGPQTIAFHPANGHRVVSTMTAAQMKKMMEGVVLFGTAKRAILDGYSSAGKTGTAQKIDPATRRYSSSKYVASFAGFAPVNNPAITIVVSLDSPVGLHQGGQVSAPVFQRVATQVLAYLHVQHDVEVKDPKRLLLQAKVKDEDLNDSSPDHPGEPLDFDEEAKADTPVPAVAKTEAPRASAVKPASQSTIASPDTNTLADASTAPASPGGALPPNGTVILDVSDGAVVPSFLGKSMRSVIEAAQTAGIEVDAFGSGVAREQSPVPGSRLPAGRRVAVRFGR
jgi:cell division protein FtsI (penicillin-binding protein 3)